MKTRFLIFIYLILQALHLHAQSDATLFGHVVDDKGEHLPFVNLLIADSRLGTSTDVSGHYMINNIPTGSHILKVQHIGYSDVTIEFSVTDKESKELNITLHPISIALDQVVISGSLRQQSLRESAVRIQVLDAGFLQKIPSTNLMQSIGMINGVQQVTACAVCGTNEIRINGLEGSNTAVLIDGMPVMGALASVYGLNGIPNSLIERIEVIKGASSTLYGAEAIGGVINIITKSAETAPRLFLNTSWTDKGERTADFSFSPFKGRKVSTLFSGSLQTSERFNDLNKDNFADLVMIRPSVSLFNKWSIARHEGRQASFAVKLYRENRAGGTRGFLGNYSFKPDDTLRGSNAQYGETILTNRFELTGVYSLPVEKDIRIELSQSGHWQDSYYGTTKFTGEQHLSFINLIWNAKAGEKHLFTNGLTARYQYYSDNTPATASGPDRSFIPGIFVQDEYKVSKQLNLVGGARLDHHTKHGLVFSPRLSAKYIASEQTILRFNAGSGFRTVNIFTEDHAALSGFREVILADDLKPEKSWNFSLSLNQTFSGLAGKGVVLDADVFYTRFSNKIIADYETDAGKIIYANLSPDEYAISRGLAVSANGRVNGVFTWSAGFTLQDVYSYESVTGSEAERKTQVLSPPVTGTFLVSWDSPALRTSLDVSGSLHGPVKLPTPYPESANTTPESEAYGLIHLLANYNVNQNIRIYIGVNNLLNWQPEFDPVINWEQPFSEDFDAANVYGPLSGRVLRAGFRIMI